MTEEQKDFYRLEEVTFKRQEVIWLLENFQPLFDLVRPSDHKETGYSDKKGKQRGHSAPFEKPAIIMAEFTSRLEQVGRDALPLLIVYSQDLEQQYYIRDFLARCLRIDVIELDKRIDNALRYITGKCPRRRDCPGHLKCVQCKSCPKVKDCKRKPRLARSYKQFCQHKRGSP